MAGYGTEAGFTAWATEHVYTVPTGDVPAALQRGSAYIDGTYGDRFPGEPTDGIEQDRAWPRTDAEDKWGNAIADNAVPTRVEHYLRDQLRNVLQLRDAGLECRNGSKLLL